ncbi:MAG: NUDIX hydrolase [Candidatus Methanoperedens sp.]|nr:NUDIX hydrolase [Candidatus Methanoperedens sp.]
MKDMEKEIKSIPNLPKKEFDRVLKMVTTTVVEVIVKNENGILLGKRNTEPFRGMWHLTGGFVHYNEKISDSVKRVAKREIGVDVGIVRLLGIYEYINEDPRGHMIALAHIVGIQGGNIAPNQDNTELKYFIKAPENMIPYQKKIFNDAMKNS